MSGRNWEQAWRNDVGPRMVDLVTEGQQTAAAGAEVYTTFVLAELGIPSEAPTRLNLPAFADVAGDGRSVASLLYGGVVKAAKAQYEPRMKDLPPTRVADLALAEAAEWIDAVATTLMEDAARAAEAVSLAQRPWVDGFVRMLDPKNPCSRCVVLAGKFYLFNAGFERHEKCRCKHIPYMENMTRDILTNPSEYFESLSAAEQDRVFTNAGAEAIRLGADPTQVVNARRGMKTAQQNPRGWIPQGRMVPTDVYGRPTFITSEGVTRFGTFGKINAQRAKDGKPKLPVRLMPESILAIARDREDSIRLLRLYGYLL